MRLRAGGAPYGIGMLFLSSGGGGGGCATPASALAACSWFCTFVSVFGFLPPHAVVANAAPANTAARDTRPSRVLDGEATVSSALQNGHTRSSIAT